MSDWAKLVKDLRVLQTTNDVLQEAAEKSKRQLQEKINELAAFCRPHCLEAVERYNKRATYKIVRDSVSLSFTPKERTLSLRVRLKTETGYEPDESFSVAEEKKMWEKLSRILDPKLKKAGINLKLAGILVPVEYFPK